MLRHMLHMILITGEVGTWRTHTRLQLLTVIIAHDYQHMAGELVK